MKKFTLTQPLVIFLSLILANTTANAQDNYHDRNHPAYYNWQRMQVQTQNDSEKPIFTGHGKMSNKEMVDYIRYQRSQHTSDNYSNVDQYNMSKSIATFPEYYNLGAAAWSNVRPKSSGIYKDKIDFVRVHNENVFFNLNPIVMYGAKFDQDITQEQSQTNFTDLALGVQFRASYRNVFDINVKYLYQNFIAKDYEIDYYNQWRTLPGFTPEQINLTNNRIQTTQPRIGIQFPIYKDYVTTSIGYDAHAYGSGMRTLFLSDGSAPYLYGKLSTKVWKLKYDNIFAKVNPDNIPGLPTLGGHKYFAAHNLSIEIFPWWQLGLFETVIFSRNQGYEASYLNPIIFYRAMERSLGSPDHIALGIQSDFFPIKNVKLYGQFLLNEFTSEFFFKNTGYWANKWGGQIGAFYTNVAGIDNLDLQAELNLIKPYTFTHTIRQEGVNISSYGNGNTPLAHELGAGFREVLIRAKYQPTNKLHFDYTTMFYQQGEDSAGINNGSNIFRSYADSKPGIFGIDKINGPEKRVWQHHLQASYELWPQLFVDLGAYYRSQDRALDNTLKEQWGVYTRVRLNFWEKAFSML